MRGA
jgi:hypothetical protein